MAVWSGEIILRRQVVSSILDVLGVENSASVLDPYLWIWLLYALVQGTHLNTTFCMFCMLFDAGVGGVERPRH